MDAARRDLALEELKHCVVKAERSGLVIHPSAARWRNAPEIAEGATVHKDQVLLLMPDLSKMQVKVGILESVVDRIKPGMAARVTLPNRTLNGEVSSVASVTRPAGWWTGNVVKYDTLIKLPSVKGLKPGLSAEVEVIIVRHEDVLTIPVAAVVETADGDFCRVKTAEGIKRRSLRLGDTNDVFTVVRAGLKEGDEIVLDTTAFMEKAQTKTRKPRDKTKSSDPAATKPRGDSKQTKSKPKVAKPEKAGPKPKSMAAQIIKLADKDGDGVLTIDEFAEEHRQYFGMTDTNKDGKVDASELDAAMKRLQNATQADEKKQPASGSGRTGL